MTLKINKKSDKEEKIKKAQSIAKTKDEANKDYNRSKIAKLHDFYKPKFKDGKLDDILIDKVKLVDKFVELGFCRYDTDDDKFLMVKISNNTLKRVSAVYIRDAFFDWVESLQPNVVEKETESGSIQIEISAKYIKSKLFRNLETYFNNMLFERARLKNGMDPQLDTLDTKFFYFQNGFISISKSGHKFHSYTELKNKVWETQILKNNFLYTDDKGNFEKFFENITSSDPARKKSLMSICGYLLHSFYDYKTFLILLTDAGLSKEGEANGRTGKTLLMKALGKMLNADDKQSGYVEIDGKTFKSNEDRKYQRADIDTNLIHINDIFAWFNIDGLFTDITDGIIVRQMYEKPFRIFSKLAMSSNKTLKLEGVSAVDRVIVFEIENYYNQHFNPEKEFHQWFFRDWDNTEWNKFYSFMIRCCITFFSEGIILPSEINYQQRYLMEFTAPEFISWFEYFYSHVILREMSEINTDVERSKRFLYDSFTSEYIDFKNNKNFSQRKLTKWIKMYLERKKIPFREERKSDDVFIFILSKPSESSAPVPDNLSVPVQQEISPF